MNELGAIFAVAKTETFWARVVIELTAEDGAPKRIDFDLQFKRLSQEKRKELGALVIRGDVDLDDAAREVVVNWRRVPGREGSTLDWSPERFEEMLDLGFAPAIIETFGAHHPKAKQKN